MDINEKLQKEKSLVAESSLFHDMNLLFVINFADASHVFHVNGVILFEPNILIELICPKTAVIFNFLKFLLSKTMLKSY